MRHYEKYEQTKNYVLTKTMQNGMFNESYKQLSKHVGISNLATSRNMIMKMVNEGLLEIAQSPKRGMGGSGIYRIKQQSGDTIEVQFQGVSIILKRTEIGYCMSKSDLEMATLSQPETFDKIIKSNKPLFESTIINVDGVDYVNQRGCFHFLTKLNVDKILPIKQQVLVDFQQMIITKMIQSAQGKVYWSEKEGVTIKHNLSELTELKIEDVEKVLADVQHEINSIIVDSKQKLNTCQQSVSKIEKQNRLLSGQLESEKHKVMGYITENTTLKTQLMSRN